MNMNEAKEQTSVEATLDEAAVVEHLQQHADFLQRHPDVLAAQAVSHDSGAAASLIERQVGVLRDNNRQLQSRLNELIEMARGNEQRVTRLNSIAKALLAAADGAAFATALNDCIRQEMRVDATFVGLRGLDAAVGTGGSAIQPLPEQSPASDAVTHVFRRGKPICGPLSAQQVEALFGAEADAEAPTVASAAMVPLGTDGVHGALVLASADGDYFDPDMGTLFLELLGELVTTGLRRHLGADVVA